MEKPLIIPFFIPHAGCPFTCVYCNQWKISRKEEEIKPEEIDQYVEEYLKKARLWPGRFVEIAFYGGSFTALPPEKQVGLLQAAAAQKKKGRIKGIRLSTRPDYLDEEILARLLSYGVTTVELGVQSLVDEVLAKACRGHDVADTARALSLLRKYPLQVGYQLMLGLPGDSSSFARLTGKKTVEARPDFVRIYPALVLQGTTLAQWYREGSYTPWSLQQAVQLAAYWLGVFSFYQIPVIRMGLQAVDNLSPEKDLVAGPYHPAFGELVESRLMLEQMCVGLGELQARAGDPLTVFFHPRVYSQVVGQKKENLCFLREKYNLAKINLMPKEGVQGNDLEMRTTLQVVRIKRQDFLERYRIR
ncbi:MAG: radical SAM protein [Clostridia bacterium]|nr:radical SAM protein [Clostridia bacterium]